ncbi:MAG: pyridoxal-phosphate dependent enzyme [Chloroflexota bacterium]
MTAASAAPPPDPLRPFVCTNCARPYPPSGFPYRCPVCAGPFDFASPLTYAPEDDGVPPRGLARYRKTFPLPSEGAWVTLGEGGTPLVLGEIQGRPVYFKCEYLNPTGSFKDRGTAVLVSALAAAGVRAVVEDSSGNAGASLAAYCARAGIRARIFTPAYASGPKVAQMEACGAEVVRVEGPRSAVSEAVLGEVTADAVYASHAHLPHVIAGMATVAFEIVEQLGDAPGSVVVPVGQGSLLLGMHRGFEALMRAGVVKRTPMLVGVQAISCAPLWALHTGGVDGLRWVREGETIAEGIRILRPLRGDAVLVAVEGSGGTLVAVDEQAIRAGCDALARRGLYVEPTSAVVYPAMLDRMETLPAPVVAVLTGSGYKVAAAGARARATQEAARP